MSYTNIAPSGLPALLQTEGLTIIDQRDADTRQKGQLADAQPASEHLINQLMRRRRSDPPVLVYCYRGNQSRDLCKLLVQFGLKRVYNLEGGWQALSSWRQGQQDHDSELRDWQNANGFDPGNLNSRIELGMSALMLAALQGRQQLVQSLLQAGADPRPINDDGHNALWFACVSGDPAVVKMLLADAGDVDNRNVNGVTCAVYAASTGKLEVLQLLVEAGADLSIRSDDGYNALDSATTLEVLRFLRPMLCETA